MDRRPEDLSRRPGQPVFPRSSGRHEEKEATESSDSRSGRSLRRTSLLVGGGIALVACTAFLRPSSTMESDEEQEQTVPAAAELAPSLDLPDPMNERVDRWIQHYLTDDRRTFEEFLSRESIYGELIREKLRARGMPEDLLYLAMIESGFSARALSEVKASGLWQFMGPTAREYGLEIGEFVDQRRDPLRATDAALDYLQRLHDRFGSWYLAAAAYNAGPSRVARAVRTAGDRPRGDEEVFWQIVDELPSETREYVPRVFAAALLAKRAEEYGFHVERPDPYRFERVWVPGGTSLSAVAAGVDLSVSILRDLNPHLIGDRTPPGRSFALRVPPGRAPQVVASLGNDWKSWAD